MNLGTNDGSTVLEVLEMQSEMRDVAGGGDEGWGPDSQRSWLVQKR